MDKFLQKLIVYAYQKIGNQRSIRSFYFILIGKRSLQATQDARLFGLEKFYGTLPLLDYDRYEKCFHAAKESKYTQLNIEDAWFYQQLYDYEINRKSMYFMERIQLLIQVLSHLKRKDVCYIPMCKRYETQKFIKQIIYVFLTIFLYLLKCPQSLILSALRAFCFCGKPHISRSIFLYFRYQSWLKSW